MKASIGFGLALAAAVAGLPAAAQPFNVLSEAEKAQGFELLFDGSLESFKANFTRYVSHDTINEYPYSAWNVKDSLGALMNLANTQTMRSRRVYGDFDLRLDIRCQGVQGIYYRSILRYSNMGQSGVEYAINDRITNAKTNISSGAAYLMYAADPVHYRPFATGEWNSVRIVAIGDSVEHWMNGVKVVGYKYHSPDWWARYKAGLWAVGGDWTLANLEPAKKEESDYIREGYIGLQADRGGTWQIRNFRINNKNPSLGPLVPTRVMAPSRHPPKRALVADLSGRILIADGRGGWVTTDGRYLPNHRDFFKFYSLNEP